MKEEIIDHDNITYKIWIGKNAQDNWDIISKSVQNDIWFHLDNVPSPHVILKIPEDFKLKVVPKQVLNKCAVLCKNYSNYDQIKKIKVIYTEIKNVTKGDKVGSVMTHKTKTITL